MGAGPHGEEVVEYASKNWDAVERKNDFGGTEGAWVWQGMKTNRNKEVNMLQSGSKGWQGAATTAAGRSDNVCYNCQRPGHFSRECRVARKCYNCDSAAHLVRNCPRQGSQRNYKTNKAPTYKNQAAITCFICGGKGHRAMDCQAKDRPKCGICGKTNHATNDCFHRTGVRPKAIETKFVGNHETPYQGESGLCIACGSFPAYVKCICSAYYCSPVCKSNDQDRHATRCIDPSKNVLVPTRQGSTWD